MFRKHRLHVILLLARLLVSIPFNAVADDGNLSDDLTALTDYCTQYSKKSLEQYIDHSDDATSISDDDKYQMLGQLFNTCLSERNSEGRNNVASENDQRNFYYYSN